MILTHYFFNAYLLLAAAWAWRRAIEGVARVGSSTDARTLSARGNNLTGLERGLLRANRRTVDVLIRTQSLVIRTERPSALAKR